jgi:hypothetical protein
MYGEAVLKASPISLTLWHSGHLFVGFNGGEGSFEQPYSITTRNWEKMEDPSAMIQGFFIYSKQ